MRFKLRYFQLIPYTYPQKDLLPLGAFQINFKNNDPTFFLGLSLEVDELKKALAEQMRKNQEELEEMKKTFEERARETEKETAVGNQGYYKFHICSLNKNA